MNLRHIGKARRDQHLPPVRNRTRNFLWSGKRQQLYIFFGCARRSEPGGTLRERIALSLQLLVLRRIRIVAYVEKKQRRSGSISPSRGPFRDRFVSRRR